MVATPNYGLSTDTTLGGNSPSDIISPSEKAIKTYIDNHSELPSQAGNADKFLTTNGTLASWATIDIPPEVTEATISEWGFTKNAGTVTSVNNVSPVNGNVTLSIPDTSNLANKDLSNLTSTGNSKFQAPLVSGTNIKTVNGNSLLGSGNISIDSLPSQSGNAGKFLTTNGAAASWADTTKVTFRDWSVT